MAGIGGGSSDLPEMLQNLNPTAEEEEVIALSDDEGENAPLPVDWVLLGKVLSPAVVHAMAIHGAMKPEWGIRLA
jgi:hypothetical protein